MPTTADDSKTYTLFYSWQSDIKPDSHGKNLIRSALRNAANALEAEFSGLRLDIDEATRGEAGSPDIPSTIFRKIESAEIFIADVSIINNSTAADRKTPNPNVLIELGYAAGLLGWQRVIMVANQEFGDIENLPFDIKQRTITKFRCPPPSSNATKDKSSIANAAGTLFKQLTGAIEEIINSSPKRPTAFATDTHAIKRKRDLNTLQDLLHHLNPDVFDSLWETAPHRLDFVVFHFWEGFHALWTASSTYLYDDTARTLMEQIHQHWDEVLSHGTHYQRGIGDFYIWHAPGDFFPSPASEEDYKKAIEELRALRKAYSELLGHLRSNYVELDLESLRKTAWVHYQKFQRIFSTDQGQS